MVHSLSILFAEYAEFDVHPQTPRQIDKSELQCYCPLFPENSVFSSLLVFILIHRQTLQPNTKIPQADKKKLMNFEDFGWRSMELKEFRFYASA